MVWYTVLSTRDKCIECNIIVRFDVLINENYQNMIQKAFQDPISALLLKNSNLSRIQFETLVIDLITDIMSENKLSFDEKTLFRRNTVSRGSFSRSLAQARKNVIRSIFTIVLLSYIGVFDAKPFDDYYFLAEKLKEYVSLLEDKEIRASKEVLTTIEAELIEGITQLATPTSIKMT